MEGPLSADQKGRSEAKHYSKQLFGGRLQPEIARAILATVMIKVLVCKRSRQLDVTCRCTKSNSMVSSLPFILWYCDSTLNSVLVNTVFLQSIHYLPSGRSYHIRSLPPRRIRGGFRTSTVSIPCLHAQKSLVSKLFLPSVNTPRRPIWQNAELGNLACPKLGPLTGLKAAMHFNRSKYTKCSTESLSTRRRYVTSKRQKSVTRRP